MYKMITHLMVVLGTICLTGCGNVSIGSIDLNPNYSETIETLPEPKSDPLLEKIEPSGITDATEIEHVGTDMERVDIEKKLETMTLDEKIGQLFIIDVQSDQEGNAIHTVNEELREKLTMHKVGGVILFKSNIQTREQTEAFIKDMQEVSAIPLFIAVDEEGGLVSRVGQNKSIVEVPFKAAFDIGQTGDIEVAYNESKRMGEVLKGLGFNLNFAPVADIYNNEVNKVIGRRSFGKTKDQVSPMVISSAKGLLSQNIQPVLKHFPGHGNTQEDSHQGLAYVNKTREELEKEELVPFLDAINQQIDVLMVGHLIVKDIDEVYPATLSSKWFEYMSTLFDTSKVLLITDAMNMGAISENYEQEEAIVGSFLAGNDLILMPKDIQSGIEALKIAYEKGIITEKRLNESVRKILSKKVQRNILILK